MRSGQSCGFVRLCCCCGLGRLKGSSGCCNENFFIRIEKDEIKELF